LQDSSSIKDAESIVLSDGSETNNLRRMFSSDNPFLEEDSLEEGGILKTHIDKFK
jgi:hypothetical protein